MGRYASATLAYGIDLGQEAPDFLNNEDSEENIETLFSAWLQSKGKNFKFPFQLLPYGAEYGEEDENFFLAYDKSVQQGSAYDVSKVVFNKIDEAEVKKILKEHGF